MLPIGPNSASTLSPGVTLVSPVQVPVEIISPANSPSETRLWLASQSTTLIGSSNALLPTPEATSVPLTVKLTL